MKALDCCALTEAGADEDANEDFVLAEPALGVFVVADGIGGRPGGAQASAAAARSFVAYLRALAPEARLSEGELRAAVAAAHAAVRAIAESDALLAGLGTTLAAVVTDGCRAWTVHVGDSRVYRFSHGKLEQLTRDHTLVEELMERHLISSRAAEKHALRNMLSRALSADSSAEPDLGEVSLGAGDWLVLATDGLAKCLPVSRVEDLMNTPGQRRAEDLCRNIMAAAVAAEPSDNVSVAVIGPAGQTESQGNHAAGG